jgi:hypothetical protein
MSTRASRYLPLFLSLAAQQDVLRLLKAAAASSTGALCLPLRALLTFPRFPLAFQGRSKDACRPVALPLLALVCHAHARAEGNHDGAKAGAVVVDEAGQVMCAVKCQHGNTWCVNFEDPRKEAED